MANCETGPGLPAALHKVIDLATSEPVTFDAYAAEQGEMAARARAHLEGLGATEHVGGNTPISVWRLKDGSYATIGTDGTIALWGKP